jgi:AbrB family looped-hinge helix DNA binding protein
MVSEISTLTTKGQVTIPKSIRNALGIEEKDQLLFVVEGDKIVLIPIRKQSLDQLFASLPTGREYPGQEKIRQAIRSELGSRIASGEE